MTSRRAALLYALGPVILAGCGGGGSTDAPAPAPAPAPPSIVQQPGDVTVVAGAAATFSVVLADGAGASYQWLRDGAPIAGATQPSLTVSQASLLDAGSVFSVRIATAGGSVTSQAAVLAVTSPPFTVIPGVVPGPLRLMLAAADNAGSMAIGADYFVRKLAPDGTVTILAGSQPTAGSTEFYFKSVGGLSFDRQRNVLVVLAGGGVTEPSCATFPVFCLNATAFLYEVTAAGLVARQPPLSGASAFLFLSADADGTLYAAGGNRPPSLGLPSGGACAVYRIAPGGNAVLLAGNPDVQGFADGPAAQALFTDIAGLAADGKGNVYLSDRNRLRRVDANGTVTTIAGNPSLSASVDGAGSAASFRQLGPVVVDSSGNVLVSDRHLIRRVTAGGQVSTLARTSFDNAAGTALAFDSSGALYVANEAGIGRFPALAF